MSERRLGLSDWCASCFQFPHDPMRECTPTCFANLTAYAIYRCKARVTASGSKAITLRRTRAGPAGRRCPCS
jgi:hypothetical protein